MNSERLAELKRFMSAQALDALLLSQPGHIAMTSGFWPMNHGLACFVLPREGQPLCILPHCEAREAAAELWEAACVAIKFGILEAPDYAEAFERLLADSAAGLRLRRVGADLGTESFAPAWNSAEITHLHGSRRAAFDRIFGAPNVVDVSPTLAQHKQVKNAFEVGQIRRANEIARMGLQCFAAEVAVGRSGLELRAAVESSVGIGGVGYQGARRVRAFAQVSTGPEETRWGFRPMVDTTARKLASGDIALLEMAVAADGYWADRTVAVVAGKATSLQRDVCALIKKAQAAVIAGLRPGLTCAQADALARDLIKQAGYEKEFLHVTGHGIGFQYHDPGPFLLPGNEEVLREGAVVTVEPGVYWEGFGGIRFEDNVAIAVGGAEVLGAFPSDRAGRT